MRSSPWAGLLAATLPALLAGAALPQEAPVTLSVQVVKRDVLLWEPILAQVRVRNTSDAPVRMVPAYEATRLRTTREEGAIQKDPRRGGGVTWWGIRRQSMASPPKPAWLIAPGETVAMWASLLNDREIQAPGTYHITLDYAPEASMVREPEGADQEPPLWLGKLTCDVGTVTVREPTGPDKEVADSIPRWHLWLSWCHPETAYILEKHREDVAATAYEPYLRWYSCWSRCIWYIPVPPKSGYGPELRDPEPEIREFLTDFPDFPLNGLADVLLAHCELHRAYIDSVTEAQALADEHELAWYGHSWFWKKVVELWKPRMEKAWAAVEEAVQKCGDRGVMDESAFVQWGFDVVLAYRETEAKAGAR